jgi:hypothetical protein
MTVANPSAILGISGCSAVHQKRPEVFQLEKHLDLNESKRDIQSFQ